MFIDPYILQQLVVDHQRELLEAAQRAQLAKAARQSRRANAATASPSSAPSVRTRSARLLARIAHPAVST
jgi:hypothetical protein